MFAKTNHKKEMAIIKVTTHTHYGFARNGQIHHQLIWDNEKTNHDLQNHFDHTDWEIQELLTNS